jgi:hypothetical protein
VRSITICLSGDFAGFIYMLQGTLLGQLKRAAVKAAVVLVSDGLAVTWHVKETLSAS